MMDIRPIKTEADYDWALQEIEQYFDKEPAKGSPEGDRFEVLAALIGAYEDKHWRIEAPEPVVAIQSYMEDRGLTQKDLASVLGSPSRASEILNKRRGLTVEMVHKLSSEWKISADILVQPYHLAVAQHADTYTGVVRVKHSRPPAKAVPVRKKAAL